MQHPTPDRAPQPTEWHQLLSATIAVLVKELRAELRTRYAINAVLLFAVSTVVVESLVLGPLSQRVNPELPLVHAALLWIALLFAAFTSLARVFVQEEEARTAAALRLAAHPAAIYLGKLIFNLALLLLLALVTVPLFTVMLRVQIGNLGLLTLVVIAGCLGLTSATTLIGAIIARASAKGALFAVLSFPLLVPLLVVAVQGSALALQGGAWAIGLAPLQVLLGYTLALLSASLFLFPVVWES